MNIHKINILIKMQTFCKPMAVIIIETVKRGSGLNVQYDENFFIHSLGSGVDGVFVAQILQFT